MVHLEPYRPSNCSEGEAFYASFCQRCQAEATHRDSLDSYDGCDIFLRTQALQINDPDYPAEWVINQAGKPTCTAFQLEGSKNVPLCPATPDLFAGAS